MHRYSAGMGADLLPHWRKSSQWFALTRAHAARVLADARVLAAFAAFCRNAWDADAQRCVVHWRVHLIVCGPLSLLPLCLQTHAKMMVVMLLPGWLHQ